MRKTLLLITILFISAASFALSDMVSVDFIDGSRTVPIEDLKDMYYSNTKDSFYLALEDTTYAFKADSSLHVTFLDSIEGQHKREREALIAIYKALDGDNWTNNENWCSDKPVSEWYGIRTDGDGYVEHIWLDMNNLSGEIPKDIALLRSLVYLSLGENHNITSVTDYISKLSMLRTLRLPKVKYLPESIFSMKSIEELMLYLPDSHFSIDLGDFERLVNLEIEAKKSSFPANINKAKNLINLSLFGFCGRFPDLSGLTELYQLHIGRCVIEDEISTNWDGFDNLTNVYISDNVLTSKIPSNLFLLPNLKDLGLRNNKLEGELPVEFTNYMSNDVGDVKFNYIDFNHLSGSISEEIQNHPNWYEFWQTIVFNNKFNYKNINLPGPRFEGVDIDGNSIRSEDVYSKNKYTILWSMDVDGAKKSNYVWNVDTMKYFHEKYRDYGVEILYAAAEWDTKEAIKAFRDEYDVPMRCFYTYGSGMENIIINNGKQRMFFNYYLSTDNMVGNTLMVVDSTGKTVFMGEVDGYEYKLDHFLYRNLFKDSIDYYVSSDYSQHMLVDTLQLATKGKGIDIVLMGDAYSDRQITDSTYYKDMLYLYNNLFTEEPYKSFQDMFNVYVINVVSDVEGYGNGPTALGGYFGEGTEVGGNDGAVMQYVLQVLNDERFIDATVIVAMNSDRFAGTCYMYYHTEPSKVDGCGLSISYFPKGGDPSTFAQLLHHEALGHGFPKLADEYAYEWNGEIPEFYLNEYTTYKTDLGWFKNVDFTNDSVKVLWSKFLFDDRYQYDELGVFEGGLTFWNGVWRPTENSIMRYNTGGFNAPSREAIYYRIHKLAYGKDWEYDYEKFVEWDAKNRKKADSPLLMPSREAIRNFVPTHPPVIKQMNWREALEGEQTPQRGQIKAKEGVSVYDKSINQLPNTNKYVFTTYSNDEQ